MENPVINVANMANMANMLIYCIDTLSHWKLIIASQLHIKKNLAIVHVYDMKGYK